MRDFLPEQLAPRLKVIETLRRVFELYGFQPLETPAMERLDILQGKYGEEGEKLSFRVMKRGAELGRALEKVVAGAAPDELADMGLRYDLTVPLARVVAQYGNQLPRPFKRYQIGEVWRADRPQAGRYRQFTQCDVDIVGTDSLLADTELIALTLDAFEALKLPKVQVLVNHRKLLQAMSEACGNPPDRFIDFCTAMDKVDKVEKVGVEKEMQERGLNIERLGEIWQAAEISGLKGRIDAMREFVSGVETGAAALDELEQLFSFLDGMGVPRDAAVFDPTLARGLDYYTGPVFEVRSKDTSIGSLGGGGRYDRLIGLFSKESIPATGTSFGLDRISEVISGGIENVNESNATQVHILLLEESEGVIRIAGKVLRSLHAEGISCDIGYDTDSKLGKRIGAADKRGSGFIVIMGSEEVANAGEKLEIPIKRLADGEQRSLTLAQAIEWIKSTQK